MKQFPSLKTAVSSLDIHPARFHSAIGDAINLGNVICALNDEKKKSSLEAIKWILGSGDTPLCLGDLIDMSI